MGGFANVLGHAAIGFEQARQQDVQRQFAAEENRRQQIGGFLQKIAGDETAHPFSRQAAINEYVRMAQSPWNKPYKFDPNVLVAPPQPPQQIAQFTPPPQSPTQLGGVSLPGQHPSTAALMSPPTPPGVFMSPEEHTRMMASRVGEVTGAQAGAEAKYPVFQRDPATGELKQVFVSGTGQQIGGGVQGAVSPYMLQGRGLRQVQYADPNTGQPLLGTHNLMTGEVYDQNGQVVPGAVPFISSLLPSVSTQSMAPSGAVTTTRTRPVGKPAAGVAQKLGAQPATPPTPPQPSEPFIGALPQAPAAQTAATAQPAAKPKVGAQPKSTAHITSSAVDWTKATDPVSLSAMAWATKGIKPVGGAMAERQVLARMKQMGLEPSLPVPPTLQKQIQESFVARNSAIGLIDDVLKNSHVLDSLLSAGKIAIGANPDGTGILTRAAGLTDQEAKVAGDFQQLIEHANLLRGPLGATGFRGQEAWSALQAQRGKIMSDPRITRQVLTGMRERLIGLNTADKMVITGQGMSAEPAAGPAAAPTPPAAQFNWDEHPTIK